METMGSNSVGLNNYNRLWGILLGGPGLSKSVISRVIIGVTPFRVLITLPIAHLLIRSPGPPSIVHMFMTTYDRDSRGH